MSDIQNKRVFNPNELDPGYETRKKVKPPKKRKKSNLWVGIVAIIMVVTVIGVQLLSLLSKRNANKTVDLSTASLLTTTAEMSSMQTDITGSGTLKEETAAECKLLTGVNLSEVYYRNGDYVNEGDVVAKVDRISVMSSIAKCQNLINQLDKELKNANDSNAGNKITSPVKGRVKIIYTHVGDSVLDTMYENEALMVISLDGMMSVSFDCTESITVGSQVDVTLSNGTTISGNVNSYLNGRMKVTVTDKDTVVDDEVTVTHDGVELGSGKLSINSPLSITGFVGKVKKVNVSLNQVIKKNDTLITLEGTNYSKNYDTLITQRDDLVKQVASLIRIYSDGVIYAAGDGVIGDIDETLYIDDGKDHSVRKGDPEEEPGDDPTDPGEDPDEPGDDPDEPGDDPDEPGDDPDVPDVPQIPEEKGDLFIMVMGSGASIPGDAKFTLESVEGAVSTFKYSDVTNGVKTLSQIPIGDYTLTVEKEDVSGYVSSVYTMTAKFHVVENTLSYGGIFILYEDESQTPSIPEIPDYPGFPDFPEFPDYPGFGDFEFPVYPGYPGMGGGNGGNGGGDDPTRPSYVVTENKMFTITAQDKMKIVIKVDELDLPKITLGQTAEVTLDALPGQSFEGTVTDINRKGTQGANYSKFQVTITIDRTENMLDGMNAVVHILMDEFECVNIPLDAITEQGGKSYVYTSYDEKNDVLGDMVEIETGRSNGIRVEIISGLTEGQTIYYKYFDTINYELIQADNGYGNMLF